MSGVSRYGSNSGRVGGDWGMVWDEGLGGGVSSEDVEKVGCGDRWGADAGE